MQGKFRRYSPLGHERQVILVRKKLIAVGIYFGVLIAVSLLMQYLDTMIINSIALDQLKNEAGSDLPLQMYYFVRNHLWIPFALVGIGLGISLVIPSKGTEKDKED